MSLPDRTLRDVLDAVASPVPTPGGGTASAIAAAFGAALLAMVSGLPSKRATTDAERAALIACARPAKVAKDHLLSLADQDSHAYEQVVLAFRLPKATDHEKAARHRAVQQALRGATDVPLNVMRCCADALKVAPEVARLGNRSAASDVSVAVELLVAGCRGADLNVRTNLDQIEDEPYRRNAREETERLTRTVDDLAEKSRTLLT